jgi:16S rRNA (uracil1498-N3)-methyltransferase
MQIDELTELTEVLSPSPLRGEGGAALFLSTERDAAPVLSLTSSISPSSSMVLFIGPEGGWTGHEIEMFKSHGLTGVKLTETILRVETAAVAVAVVAMVAAGGCGCPPNFDELSRAAKPRAIGSDSTHA